MFNIGPSSGGGFPDWLKQKTGGNTGITGGMRRGSIQGPGMQRPPMGQRPPMMQRPPMGPVSGKSPFGMGPMPTRRPEQPVSGTNPVGRPRPNIIPMPESMPPGMDGGMVAQPGQQPIEENQLWRTYNRLLGGSMAPRMLL